jgi:pyruvate kinase
MLASLNALLGDMIELQSRFAPELARTHAGFRKSAGNLLHYLSLRHRDLRPLQEKLANFGLSSLGRSEPHVMATLDAVLRALYKLAGQPQEPPAASGVAFSEGPRLLAEHTRALLGPAPAERGVRIMVTMGTEGADDYELVREMVAKGMDCARINTAHDHPDAWAKMIEHVRRARSELGRNCRIEMDLAGPKVRTGPVEPGPKVIEWHPRRDDFGRITANVRIWLTPEEDPVPPPAPADVCLPVAGQWLKKLRVEDRIEFTDARGAARSMKVTDTAGGGCRAECSQTSYVTPGIVLQVRRLTSTSAHLAKVGDLAPRDQAILLRRGDPLILTREPSAGKPALLDAWGNIITPATISCTLPELFADVRPNHKIWFDDGKLGGVVTGVTPEGIKILITQARTKGFKLRADKGINLPDSKLSVPALSHSDIDNLPFVVKHAELVGMSFARTASDVLDLQSHLKRLGGEALGIILKIETRQGFENLPNLLLALMRHPVGGVMIARGDLAVECGYERLAELQEEILWVCEAAHMPVIWATQVLESLAKEGQASRAEITDAAMGERAECVMLNKGPHIVEALETLNDILRRMQHHQLKKTSQLRPLHLDAVHSPE